jgi:hypothetical protein
MLNENKRLLHDRLRASQFIDEEDGRTGRIDPDTGKIDSDPTISLPGGYIWVRLAATLGNPNGRAQVPVLNIGRVTTRRADVAVTVAYNRKGQRVIKGADEEAARQLLGSLASSNFYSGDALPPELNTDPMPLRNLTNLFGRISTAVTVEILPGWYVYNRTRIWFAGGTIDLASVISGLTASMKAPCIIAIDLSTGNLATLVGSEVGINTATFTETDYEAVSTAGYLPLWGITIKAGQTAYDGAHPFKQRDGFVDLRPFIVWVDGDVAGAASSTDNAIVRWDGAGGKTLQDSGVLINDNDQTIFPDSATYPPLNVTERSAAPSTPSAGDIYLDDGVNTASGNPGWRRWNGLTWEDISAGSGGSGDVTGPAASTDNAIARFDGTTGKVIQNSGPTIDDDGNMTIVNTSDRVWLYIDANNTGTDLQGGIAWNVDGATYVELFYTHSDPGWIFWDTDEGEQAVQIRTVNRDILIDDRYGVRGRVPRIVFNAVDYTEYTDLSATYRSIIHGASNGLGGTGFQFGAGYLYAGRRLRFTVVTALTTGVSDQPDYLFVVRHSTNGSAWTDIAEVMLEPLDTTGTLDGSYSAGESTQNLMVSIDLVVETLSASGKIRCGGYGTAFQDTSRALRINTLNILESDFDTTAGGYFDIEYAQTTEFEADTSHKVASVLVEELF